MTRKNKRNNRKGGGEDRKGSPDDKEINEMTERWSKWG
jgi:hypothetical protein